MEIFNALPTCSEDAVGIISTMLGAAIFLRGSKFDGISTDLLNATHEYSLDISLIKPRINKPTAPTDYIPNNIGYRIQIARENLGMSEDDLARLLNTYSDHISDWECGVTEPPASMVIPLANALKCDPMWLLTGQGNNANQAAPAPVSIMKGADLANIGVRIKNRRNETGMGVDKLANAIDVPIHQIYQWEAGKAIPHSGYYDRLAKALNTSVTWLLTGKITHQDLSGAGKQQHLPASQQADALSHEVPLR